MTGRNLFEKYNGIITLLFNLTSLIPKKIQIWNFHRIRGKVGKRYVLQRYFFIKRYSKTCGSNIYIGPNVTLKNIENLSLGNNCSIHDFCYIDCSGGLTIGNDVSIANSSSIITEEHTYTDDLVPIKYQPIEKKSVFIGHNVWVASGVRILGGTSIESGCVIGAGTVTKGFYENNSIVVGIPGKVIRRRY